jgi:hypothetical protein
MLRHAHPLGRGALAFAWVWMNLTLTSTLPPRTVRLGWRRPPTPGVVVAASEQTCVPVCDALRRAVCTERLVVSQPASSGRPRGLRPELGHDAVGDLEPSPVLDDPVVVDAPDVEQRQGESAPGWR